MMWSNGENTIRVTLMSFPQRDSYYGWVNGYRLEAVSPQNLLRRMQLPLRQYVVHNKYSDEWYADNF